MQSDLTSSRVQTESANVAFTWEHLLYGVLLICAAILRLSNLNQTPLSPAEAENGWGVWHFWQPALSDRMPDLSSAAWFSLTALLSQLTGYTDVALRIIPALAGIGAILAISRLRPFTGRMGSLIAGLLLVVSPLLVSISRSADGRSLAILALIISASLWLQYRQTANPRSLMWLAGWLAFGLTTAPLFYSGLCAFALAWLLESKIGPSLELSQTQTAWPPENNWRKAAITFAIVFVASATMFLLNPAGIGTTTGIFESWISAFGGYSQLNTLTNPISILLNYQFGLILLAVPAMLIMTINGDRQASFLGYWLIASILLFFLQVGELSNTLIVILPAALIIGRAFDQTVARIPSGNLFSTYPDGGMGFPVAGIGGIVLLIAATYLGRASRTGIDSPSGSALFILCVICVALVAAILITVLFYDAVSAATGLLLLTLTMSAVYGWSYAWRLGDEHAIDTRERWVQTATDDEIFILNDTLHEIGLSSHGFGQSLEIQSTVDTAPLRWYLRSYDNVRFVETIPSGSTADIIITPDGADLQANSSYTGTDFGLSRTDQKINLDTNGTVRWLLFGDAAPAIQDQRIVLWVRTDLLPNR